MKQLHIRNHRGGMIWQVYNIQHDYEAVILQSNAKGNGFYYTEIVEACNDETFPGWRDTDRWTSCVIDYMNEQDEPTAASLFASR